MINIKGSRAEEVKVGQAMAWERRGEETEDTPQKKAAWMEGETEREGWSQAGRSSGVSCEEAPSVHGSKAPLQTEEGTQTDMGPSCLAQINPGGSRRVPIPLNTTSIAQTETHSV